MRSDAGEPDPAAADTRSAALTVGEVRALATTGAAVLGARSALVYPLGIAANLVLAHLLAPRDFGIVALGTVLVVLGSYLAEGGFGAALIRRKEGPTRVELETANGMQLAATGLLAALAAAAAPAFGHDGAVIATMAASLPLAVLRTPSAIVLERRLQYRAIATADVVEALTYYAWAVGAVLLGFGVWGLATAVIARSIAGSATLIAIGPVGVLRPRWSWALARPLVAFGAQVQAVAVLQVAREQGLNVLVALIAGISTLGVWNLAWRVVQIPLLLALTIGRVAFPALARLIDAEQDPRPLIERGVAIASILLGFVAVALVGLAPLVPDIVGDKWRAVPAVLFWSGMALVVGPPIFLATTGYLLAIGRAGAVAIATLVSTLAWFGVTSALLPRFGAAAVGVGWLAGAAANAVMLWRPAAARSGATIGFEHAASTTFSALAVVSAWGIAVELPEKGVGAALGLAAGYLILSMGFTLVSRPALHDTRSLVAQALRAFRS